MDDRSAILEVISNYSYTWDEVDADGWANVFLEDGVAEFWTTGGSAPNRQFAGREALASFARESFGGNLAGIQTRHFQTNTIFLELTDTVARARTMFSITHRGPDDAAPRLVVTGIYTDEFRKTDAGWKIARRALYGDRPTR